MRNISIAFGGIHAVEDVRVELFSGEVLGLLGHNGAGKSTLIKILSGAYRRDAGEIHINGERATINKRRSDKPGGRTFCWSEKEISTKPNSPAWARPSVNSHLSRPLILKKSARP